MTYLPNKVAAVALLAIGIFTMPWLDGDATFLVFSIMLSVFLFFTKYDPNEEEDDE